MDEGARYTRGSACLNHQVVVIDYDPVSKGNPISKFKGVQWHNSKDWSHWRARIRINGHPVTIYESSDEILCAQKYDAYIIKNDIINKRTGKRRTINFELFGKYWS
jgi:hypothetical protein